MKNIESNKINEIYRDTLRRLPTYPNNIREKVRNMLETFQSHRSEKLQREIENLTGLTGDYMAMDEGEPPQKYQNN